MKKLGILIAAFGMFALVSIASANTADILQPASTITYNEDLTVNGTGRFDSVYIGKQDEGGVTFFNGTIVNSTIGEDEADNPVTFGDNVRIDGELFRTEAGGDNPIKLADTLKPQTTATYDLGTTDNQFRNAYFSGTVTTTALSGMGIVNSTNILDGTIATSDLANSAVTTAKIYNGTINTADLADEAVTNNKIADGTITYSKLSTSAVMTDNMGDNIVTAEKMDYTNSHGYAKAGGVVQDDGTLLSSFNNVGGDITVNNPSGGAYAIVIPGITTSDMTMATIYGIDKGGISAQVSAANQINVYTYNITGEAYTNHYFNFVVY
jgi:hypothetical protein